MWRNTTKSFGLVGIALHWLIAALFLCQLPLGYLTQIVEERPALQFELFQWHKSVGFLILALAIPRLVWAVLSKHPHLPATSTKAEIAAARAVRVALYTLTIAVPVAGWAVASASPLRIPSYAFNLVVVPHLPLPVSEDLEILFSRIHAVLAYTAGALVALHIAAALRHHLNLKDPTLIRMFIPGPRDE